MQLSDNLNEMQTITVNRQWARIKTYRSRRIIASAFHFNLQIKTSTVCFKFLGFKVYYNYPYNYDYRFI